MSKQQGAASLGEVIRAARESKGIGLNAFARDIGMSRTYLSRVETGQERNPPTEERLSAIAIALALDADYLLHLAGRIPSDVQSIVLGDPALPAAIRLMGEMGVTGAEMARWLGRRKA